MCNVAAARAGLFAEPTDGHPLGQRRCRHAEPTESEASSKTSLRSGVIAFEHNGSLHSVQVEIEIAGLASLLMASLFRFGDSIASAPLNRRTNKLLPDPRVG